MKIVTELLPSGKSSAEAGSMSKHNSDLGERTSFGDGEFSGGYVCGWGNGNDSSLLLESSVLLS